MKGRGTSANPPNRFESLQREQWLEDEAEAPPHPLTQFLPDVSKSIISTNDSPDVGFTASVNPYRGCEHGCAYCYARPTHEYLGFSAGLDFETKIMVKERAPELLRDALSHPSWQPQVVAMSGVTDCYQPIERKWELTRRCLRVLAEFRNPVVIITKNFLVTRDLDLLWELARFQAVGVMISITTLKPDLCGVMEPRTSRPARRLEAVRLLAQAGVPVGVNIQPVIPGLTDEEIPAIVKVAVEAGARFAASAPVRLPHGVKDLFVQWLETHFPNRKDKVLHRIQSVRGGKLNDPNFHTRMQGEGEWARQIRELFRLAAMKYGLPQSWPALSTASFRRPTPQLPLF